MTIKTYHGSCHCGAVRFEADIDLSAGTGKCNCTLCTKMRKWGTAIKPDAFRLLSGEGDLARYGRNVEHLFCKHCGIQPFGRGHIKEIGGDFVSVNLACLDDLDPTELAEAPVRYFNGRDNDWFNVPKETRHL